MMEKDTKSPEVEIILTADGSLSLFVPAMGEHYHSVNGAITESIHIFINAGLKYVMNDQNPVRILEIGFGTGLNAFLTWHEARAAKINVHYTAIEKYPLKQEVYHQLNYPELLDYPSGKEYFRKMHELQWDAPYEVTDNFILHKINTNIGDYHPGENRFDLVYFDAFGPDFQPEMWSTDIFREMAYALKPGGVLVTYSTKGTVKRSLKEAGFSIEKLPGPPGKREFLRGTRL